MFEFGDCVGTAMLYSAQIGLRNSTQLCVLWIPAFAGMTVIKFFANHFVGSITHLFPPILGDAKLARAKQGGGATSGGYAHTSTEISMSGDDFWHKNQYSYSKKRRLLTVADVFFD